MAVTIPAVVGPYQNVHATLTQASNSVVTSASVQAVGYLLGASPTPPTSGVVRTNWNANQAIALSSGTNDSGLFQLNFNDERYLFFEGTGAVSSWQLDLPKASNQFDFDAISDVVISLKYTAYDGGATFRQSVLDLQREDGTRPLQDYAGTKYVSVRQFYPNAWHQFLQNGTTTVVLVRKMFPPNLSSLAIDLSTAMAALVLAPPEGADSLPVGLAGPQGYDTTDPFAARSLAVELTAAIDPGSDLLLDNGAINPERCRDLLLVVPFTGRLDWGASTT